MLQSLGPVLRDLQEGRNEVPSLENMTSSNTTQQTFQLRKFFCGDDPTQPKAAASHAMGLDSQASSDSGDSSSSSSSSTSESSVHEIMHLLSSVGNLKLQGSRSQFVAPNISMKNILHVLSK